MFASALGGSIRLRSGMAVTHSCCRPVGRRSRWLLVRAARVRCGRGSPTTGCWERRSGGWYSAAVPTCGTWRWTTRRCGRAGGRSRATQVGPGAGQQAMHSCRSSARAFWKWNYPWRCCIRPRILLPTWPRRRNERRRRGDSPNARSLPEAKDVTGGNDAGSAGTAFLLFARSAYGFLLGALCVLGDHCVDPSLRAAATSPLQRSHARRPMANLLCGWLCRFNAETTEDAEPAEKEGLGASRGRKAALPWR